MCLTEEDVRKINDEINLISHQRFLLLTLSITVFAAFVGIFVPKDSSAPASNIIVALCIMMQLFFYAIAVIASTMRYITRCQATFLIVNQSTKWEIPWRQFREKNGYKGLAAIEKFIFIFLIALASLIPVIITILSSSAIAKWHCIPILTGFIIMLLIIHRHSKYRKKENDSEKLWNDILFEKNHSEKEQ